MATTKKKKTKIEEDLREQLKDDEYYDFFKFLGIEPGDFEEVENDINFDDYSN